MNTNLIYISENCNLDDERFFGYHKYVNILMCIILSPKTLCHKLVAEEWGQLFILMDILYGDALKNWLADYNYLSEEEIALCYFCYIGIKHRNQAIFFGISSQSLSKRKQRLKDKLAISHTISLEKAIRILAMKGDSREFWFVNQYKKSLLQKKFLSILPSYPH